jgi:hypothetical protein
MVSRFLALLFIISINIVSPVLPAQGERFDPNSIHVRIDPQGDHDVGGGSGVIIRRQGQEYTILTAYHVVKTKKEYEVLIFDSNQKIVGRHLVHKSDIRQVLHYDLAEIVIRASKDYPVAMLGNSSNLNPGEEVTIYGYPLPSSRIVRRLSAPTPISGRIVARLPTSAILPRNEGALLKINALTEGGMSGGAVIDKNGELIGILVEADQDASGNKISSLAIPIDLYPYSQAIPKRQQLKRQESKPPIEYANKPEDEQCIAPFSIPYRYRPQGAIDVSYLSKSIYSGVPLEKLTNKSMMSQYDKQLVSFNAVFFRIEDGFWIYETFGLLTSAEHGNSFLAIIISRSGSLSGLVIDKKVFDKILKIGGYSIVKIDAYAEVRHWHHGSTKSSLDPYMILKLHRIQVICDPTLSFGPLK